MAAPYPADGVTVAGYLGEWLDLIQTQVQPATWDSYRRIVDRYVLPRVGETPLAALTAHDLTLFYLHLLREGGRNGQALSLRTVRYVHGILHKALGDACRRDLLPRNVSELATLPKRNPKLRAGVPTDEVQSWTAQELRTFLAETADDPDNPLWTVAAGTGMRRGELLGLSWAAVDLDRRLVHVRRALSVVATHAELKAPKNSQSRTLTLDEHTAGALERQAACQDRLREACGPTWRNDWDLVFTGPKGKPRRPDSVSRCFRYAVRNSSVRAVRFHDLRHTHATLMLEAGVPVKVVSERLGHATVQLTLDVYAHCEDTARCSGPGLTRTLIGFVPSARSVDQRRNTDLSEPRGSAPRDLIGA